MHKAAAPGLSLTVQYASAAQNLPTRAQLRRWIKAALQRDARMTLRIVDEAEGRELNRSYRNKDYATNVLTFVYDDEEPTPQPSLSGGLTGSSLSRGGREGLGRLGGVVGDVVICAPVVEKEARTQCQELTAHYAHLAIHAALHLQGYNHENEADAAGMEALETQLMLKLRYPDPYQET
ncbi:MAG TPA: rRNA maturation RNase YbeY [Gallionella sp.]|jgi:probable rRNA maturation factor|nr:rRNA maturation RNase YbeY [Gallionella sp.]